MPLSLDRLTVSIPSHPVYLRALRGFFTHLLTALAFHDDEMTRIVLAVHEACANIIEHGYQGDPSQRIDLTVLITTDMVTIDIRDYGRKPQRESLHPRALDDVRPGGLGMHFMQSIMDSVTYDLSLDIGTLVRMTKRRSGSCKSP